MASHPWYSWRGVDDPHRIDHAVIGLGDGVMRAHGTSTTAAYGATWNLAVADGWITRRLGVSVRGDGWSRALDLTRAADGTWSAQTRAEGGAGLPPPGLADPDSVAGALDCDLGLCPATNTMPIRRLGLLGGGVPETDLVMAWVEVPSLRVIRSDQVYSSAGPGVVRYRSYSRDFTGELSVDADGVVVDYPSLARRIAAPGGMPVGAPPVP